MIREADKAKESNQRRMLGEGGIDLKSYGDKSILQLILGIMVIMGLMLSLTFYITIRSNREFNTPSINDYPMKELSDLQCKLQTLYNNDDIKIMKFFDNIGRRSFYIITTTNSISTLRDE